MPTDRLAAALWLLDELALETTVETLRVLCPDSELGVLRQTAAMILIEPERRAYAAGWARTRMRVN